MSFAEAWTSATTDTERSEAPEPGVYEVTLEDARAWTAQSGTDWFAVDLHVIAGASTGHQWSVLANLSKEGGVKAAKSMSAKLGVAIDEVSGLADLDRLLKVQVGNYYEVDVVQRGDFRNTYIRDRITGEQPAESDVPSDFPSADSSGSDDAEDIPFKARFTAFEEGYHHHNPFVSDG